VFVLFVWSKSVDREEWDWSKENLRDTNMQRDQSASCKKKILDIRELQNSVTPTLMIWDQKTTSNYSTKTQNAKSQLASRLSTWKKTIRMVREEETAAE
jgi:hypothetical protein